MSTLPLVEYEAAGPEAKAVFDEEMPALGAEFVDGKWTYGGEPIVLIYLIRPESALPNSRNKSPKSVSVKAEGRSSANNKRISASAPRTNRRKSTKDCRASS